MECPTIVTQPQYVALQLVLYAHELDQIPPNHAARHFVHENYLLKMRWPNYSDFVKEAIIVDMTVARLGGDAGKG